MISLRWHLYNAAFHLICYSTLALILFGVYSIIPNMIFCIFLSAFFLYTQYKLSVYLFVNNNFFN